MIQDFSADAFRIEPVSMAYAGLIFEYVDIGKALCKITESLRDGGMLVVLLQSSDSSSSPVTESEFESLKVLSSAMNLVHPNELEEVAEEYRLEITQTSKLQSPAGKPFQSYFFKKMFENSGHLTKSGGFVS